MWHNFYTEQADGKLGTSFGDGRVARPIFSFVVKKFE